MRLSHSQTHLGSQQVANATKARDSESLKEVVFSILFYFPVRSIAMWIFLQISA